jgi:hypothetical protein
MVVAFCKFLKHLIWNELGVLNLIFYKESTGFFELNHILDQILIPLLAQMIHPMFVESGA